MNADFDDARRGLERLAFYTQTETAGVEIQRLGGLTNRVFMVSGPRGRHIYAFRATARRPISTGESRQSRLALPRGRA